VNMSHSSSRKTSTYRAVSGLVADAQKHGAARVAAADPFPGEPFVAGSGRCFRRAERWRWCRRLALFSGTPSACLDRFL